MMPAIVLTVWWSRLGHSHFEDLVYHGRQSALSLLTSRTCNTTSAPLMEIHQAIMKATRINPYREEAKGMELLDQCGSPSA